MGKNVQHLVHIKSNVIENGKPKLPAANVILEGELAINYVANYETISLKNSSGDITTFSSDNYYSEKKLGSGFTGVNSARTITEIIEDNELINSQALNDLESRKAEKTDLQEEFNVLNDRISNLSSNVNTKVDQTSYDSYTSTTKSSIESMELTLVASINDIESRMTDSIVIAALAERIRELEERVKKLESV